MELIKKEPTKYRYNDSRTLRDNNLSIIENFIHRKPLKETRLSKSTGQTRKIYILVSIKIKQKHKVF